MQTVRTSEELTRALAELGGTVALVPTMGALHAGHLALIDEAKRRADHVVATIFVNPTQFDDKRISSVIRGARKKTRKLLAARGCDLLWMPRSTEIYPPGFATTIHVSGVTERWEGEVRPGHFDGVATVVAKLLLAVRPDVAVFGEKDFQQLAVIRRMAADLGLGVEIVGGATVRDRDGLALSSRNQFLSADERRARGRLAAGARDRESRDSRRNSSRRGASIRETVAGRRRVLAGRLCRAGRRGDPGAARQSRKTRCA